MPRDPMIRAMRVAGPLGLLYTAVATGIAHFWAGSWGEFGAILGGVVPLVFFGITSLTAVLARKLGPTMLGFAVLASWVPKMLGLLLFLHWLKGQDFYDRTTFLVTLLGGTIALLGLEGWVVTRAPQFYSEP